LRIGIHIGDVVEENDGDLMGDGVNIAARLEGIANPGSIFLSEDAYRQVKARLDAAVGDVGARQLKNIAEPMRVCSVEVGKPAAPSKAAPVFFERTRRGARRARGSRRRHGRGVVFRRRQIFDARGVAVSFLLRTAVAVLPFANASGDAKNDALALRIGQKSADYLGTYTWARTIWRSGSAAKSAADPIVAGQELGARNQKTPRSFRGFPNGRRRMG
jgi:adenylate cyclase